MPATKVKSTWTSTGALKFSDNSATERLTLDSVAGPIGPGIVRNIRTRFTIAQVNAGASILAAVAGYKYRLIDCKAIAIGGAVGTLTTVDILGTQTTSQKLVAFAQASLTRSAVLTAGGSGAAVLADGASFVQNDANTAITIGKTGGTGDTATHVDVILTYELAA